MAYPIYNAPTPEQVNIDRSRKMAEMLRQQAQDPLQGQMVSGHYVGPSWTQGLAKILAGWKSGKMEGEADEKQKAYDTGAESSMGEIQKMYSDPNANDEQRNAAFMAHSQKYGGRGIDTYLQAQNATTQMRNAATAAENARRKSEKISQDAEQGTGFLKALFPGAAFKQKVGGEDYDVDYMGLDEQGNPVNQVQPMTVGFDQEAARTFGFDDDAMGRIMSVAQKDPKLASRIALEEYKRLSKGKSEAKDVLAKERAMAEAMNMPVGDYLRQKMTKSGQNININNVMPDKAAEFAAKKEGADLGEQFAMIENKYSALDSVREAKTKLAKGIYAGTYGDLKKAMAKGSFGVIGDRQKAINTEEFVSYIGNTVVPRLKEFGGNDSNEEMRYLKSIMGGDTNMEPEAIANIIDSAERKILRGIERLQRQRSSLEDGQMPDMGPGPSRGSKPQPSAKTAAPQSVPGVRKYNPATGRIE